jgi:hypothetical protein
MTFIFAFGIDKCAVRSRDLAAGEVTDCTVGLTATVFRKCGNYIYIREVLEPSMDKCNNHVGYSILSVVTKCRCSVGCDAV